MLGENRVTYRVSQGNIKKNQGFYGKQSWPSSIKGKLLSTCKNSETSFHEPCLGNLLENGFQIIKIIVKRLI